MFSHDYHFYKHQNISVIMPHYFRQRHDSYLSAFLDTGRQKVTYDQLKVFGMNRAGFIMPLWLMVKIHVSLAGSLQFIGFIRPISSS